VISHGRYLVFQMAEVAVPRELFSRALDWIGLLRPPDVCSVLTYGISDPPIGQVSGAR
jgi:hypothetical protein